MAACARVGRVAALRMSRGDNLLVSSCTPPLVLSMHWHWLSLPAVRCGGIATVGVVPDPCRARALLSAALLVRLTPCRHALAPLAALGTRQLAVYPSPSQLRTAVARGEHAPAGVRDCVAISDEFSAGARAAQRETADTHFNIQPSCPLAWPAAAPLRTGPGSPPTRASPAQSSRR